MISRDRQLAAAGAAQLAVEHLERVRRGSSSRSGRRACGFAHLAQHLHVAQRHGEQRGRRFDRALTVVFDLPGVIDAEDAEHRCHRP